jgi:integrase
MSRIKFTAAAVARATQPGYHWFDAPRGLAVRVRDSGERAFYLRYILNGKQVIKRVASIDADLKTVNGIATSAISLVAKGEDPHPPAEARGLTVADYCRQHVEYLRSHGTSKGRKLTEAGSEDLRDYYTAILKVRALGALEPKALTKPVIAAWFREHTIKRKVAGKNKYTGGIVAANRARSMLLAALRAGGAEFPENLFRETCAKAHKEKARERVLSVEEVARLNAVLAAEPATWRAFFAVLLRTGLRKGELRSARKDDCDLDAGTLTIRAEQRGKSGKPITVALDAPAVELIRAAWRERPPFGGWVFPSLKKRGAHLMNVDDRWLEVRAKAGIPDVRLHDLRRSFGTFAAVAGASAEQISTALGNVSSIAAKHYIQIAGRADIIADVQAKAAALLDGRSVS